MSRTISNVATAALRSRIVVFLAIALPYGGYVSLTGPRVASDSPEYIGWANNLVAGSFHLSAVHDGGPSSAPMLALRSGFIYVLAVLKLLAGEHWPVALVVLNVLATALAAALLTTLIWRTCDNAVAAWIGVACFLCAYDILAWTPFVLSDSLFLLPSTWVFVELSRIASKGADRFCWLRLLMALVLAASLRPTGVVLFGIALVGLPLAAYRRRRNDSSEQKSDLMVWLGAAAAILLIMLTAAFFYQRPERWPLRALQPVVRAYADDFAKGKVINDRPVTYHTPPRTIVAYAAISLDRFVRFFQVVTGGFSRLHKLFNVVFFVPVYVLAAIGVWSIGKSRYREAAPTAMIAVVGLLMFAAFHSVTLLDFDWRYRIPALPFLFFLSALGARTIADLRSRHSWPAAPQNAIRAVR